MSLRLALFDLWPSPWPEECKKHAWSYAWATMGSSWWMSSMWRCTICGQHKSAEVRDLLPLSGTPRAPRKTTAKCEKL